MPTSRSPTRAASNNPSTASTGTDNMTENEAAHVYKVSMRIPPFWPEEPELWFAQLENQFLLNGISQDNTKYAHVVAQLDTKFAREVKDIITNPPTADKYGTIKNNLIQRLSASQEQRIRQLLEHEELGDRKPSQFLRHLRALAGSTVPEQLLRSLWLGRLPQQTQIILATRTQDRLDEVAEQADRIQEVSCRTVSEVNTTCDHRSLLEQIDKLSSQVAELTRQRRKPGTFRRRSRSRSRPRTEHTGICYYHRKFGKTAHKCAQPCNYQTPKEQGGH